MPNKAPRGLAVTLALVKDYYPAMVVGAKSWAVKQQQQQQRQ